MTLIPSPPSLQELLYGTKLCAGLTQSTIIADFDFETYSEAGFIWKPKLNCFKPPLNAITKGLSTVGIAVYAEHPSTEVLSLAYDLKDGKGKHHWIPGLNLPFDLFEHLNKGALLEAWNVTFERYIWEKVCIPKYGFPKLPMKQLRCAMAKSRAFGLPGSLEAAGNVLNIRNKKLNNGKELIKKFCIPRNPTRLNTSKRILPTDNPSTARELYDYNLQDIVAESEISSLIPDLQPSELEFWQYDQIINARGVQLDTWAIINCISLLEQAYIKYNDEIKKLTNDQVNAASEIQKLKQWMKTQNIITTSLNAESLEQLLLIKNLPDNVKRVLQIRSLIGSAAVKKIYAMLNQSAKSGRVHELFLYHAARTGRAAGTGPQPQNLPNGGPTVSQCVKSTCERYFNRDNVMCPWCGFYSANNNKEWNIDAMEQALEIISQGDLELLEDYFGNAIETISGCLRGLFIASPGHDLICSDYSAIEAVVLAALAGEKWRLEVFETHGKIYEMSASKITGIPFEDFIQHKEETGQHHPMRKKVGKVAELASGFQGWVGAWKQFGADEFFTEDEIKKAIVAWRKASPKIVEFWGGQIQDWHTRYYGLEGCAIQAVMYPGQEFTHNGITYLMQQDILYCRLLSGRYLVYHKPRLTSSERRQNTHALSFEGWNTNPKNGTIGWIRMQTYGGKLTENVVQATARDILAHAIVNLEKAGYSVVLHVHDEIVAEVPENFGSLEEFEKIMSDLPAWCQDWPVIAKNGWQGKRYRK